MKKKSVAAAEPAARAQSKPARKPPPAKAKVWATNMSELGALLQPPRERKSIQRALARVPQPGEPPCPGRTPDGRYHVARWQSYLAAIGTIGHTAAEKKPPPEPAGIEAELKRERIGRERAERLKLERENAVAEGTLIIKRVAGDDVSTALAQLKNELLKLPSILAPTVIAFTNPVDAELFIRGEINKSLRLLATPKIRAITDAATPQGERA